MLAGAWPQNYLQYYQENDCAMEFGDSDVWRDSHLGARPKKGAFPALRNLTLVPYATEFDVSVFSCATEFDVSTLRYGIRH